MRLRIITLCFSLVSIYSCRNSIINEYYSNGKLKSSYQLRNDKIEGLKIDYSPNGQRREAFYKNDHMNGEYRIFSNSNKLIEFGMCENDSAFYKRYYDKDGNPSKEFRLIRFVNNQDTMLFGNEFTSNIYLTGPSPQNNIVAYCSTLPIDSIGALSPLRRVEDSFLVQFKPAEVGIYKIYGLVRLNISDSIVNTFSFGKQIVVLSDKH